MSALAYDPKELNRRIAAADSEIGVKEEALKAKMAELKEAGVTSATITPEDAAAITEATREIDGLKADRMTISDYAQSEAERVARSRPEDSSRGVNTLHAQLFAGKGPGQIISGGIETPSVQVRDRDSLISAVITGRPWFGAAATADLSDGIPIDQRLYPTVAVRRRVQRLFDYINVGATDSDLVRYTRQTVRTSAAAETALGTAYSEASFDFAPVDAPVKSIGHFTTAYRENIADAAQFDTLVRTQLQEDVMLRLESQILIGDGSGENLTGILNSGPGVVTRDTSNERRVHAILRAITTVRTAAFREPTAVLLSPLDYQDMIIEETNLSTSAGAALAFVPDITGATPGTVWGLPIIVSTVETEGTGVVGYWPEATLWVREGVNLRVSDSHSDYFTKRQVAILADMRGAFSVQRPASFCRVNNL